jgi:hypothetical protein
MPEREYVDFKELKRRVSIEQLLEHYDLIDQMQEKDDDTLIGRCPITQSKSETAFKVRLDKNIWYSFALEEDGAGGNVLDFVARMEDTDVLGAANLMAEWFDTGSEESDAEPEGEAAAETEEARALDIFETFEAFFADELDILHSGARSDIKDALGEHDVEDADIEAVAERLSSWILRAYQRGYKLGKMQGRIDERISSLQR